MLSTSSMYYVTCFDVNTNMAFTKEDKILIKVLRQEKGYGAKRFVKEFLNRSWSLSSLNKLLKKIDQTGTVDRKLGSGKNSRHALLKTSSRLKVWHYAKKMHRESSEQIARDIGISKTAVHDIIA